MRRAASAANLLAAVVYSGDTLTSRNTAAQQSRRHFHHRAQYTQPATSKLASAKENEKASAPATKVVPTARYQHRSVAAATAAASAASIGPKPPANPIGPLPPNQIEDLLILSFVPSSRATVPLPNSRGTASITSVATVSTVSIQATALLAIGNSITQPWYKEISVTLPSGEGNGSAPVGPSSAEAALLQQAIDEQLIQPFLKAHVNIKTLLLCPLLATDMTDIANIFRAASNTALVQQKLATDNETSILNPKSAVQNNIFASQLTLEEWWHTSDFFKVSYRHTYSYILGQTFSSQRIRSQLPSHVHQNGNTFTTLPIHFLPTSSASLIENFGSHCTFIMKQPGYKSATTNIASLQLVNELRLSTKYLSPSHHIFTQKFFYYLCTRSLQGQHRAEVELKRKLIMRKITLATEGHFGQTPSTIKPPSPPRESVLESGSNGPEYASASLHPGLSNPTYLYLSELYGNSTPSAVTRHARNTALLDLILVSHPKPRYSPAPTQVESIIIAPLPLIQTQQTQGDSSKTACTILSSAVDDLTAGGYDVLEMVGLKSHLRSVIALHKNVASSLSNSKNSPQTPVPEEAAMNTSPEASISTSDSRDDIISQLLLPMMQMPPTPSNKDYSPTTSFAAHAPPVASSTASSSTCTPIPILVCLNLKHFIRAFRGTVDEYKNGRQRSDDGIGLLQEFFKIGGLVWCCETAEYYLSGLQVSDAQKYPLSSSSTEHFLTRTDCVESRKEELERKIRQAADRSSQVPYALRNVVSHTVGQRKVREDSTKTAIIGLIGKLAASHQQSPFLPVAGSETLSAAVENFGVDGNVKATPQKTELLSQKVDTVETKAESAMKNAISTLVTNNLSATVTASIFASQLAIAAATNQLQSVLYRTFCLIATEEMEYRGLALAVSGETTGNTLDHTPSLRNMPSENRATRHVGDEKLPTLSEIHDKISEESARYVAFATTGLLNGYRSKQLTKAKPKRDTSRVLYDDQQWAVIEQQQATVANSFNLNSTAHVAVALYGGCIPVMGSSFNNTMAIGLNAPGMEWGQHVHNAISGSADKTPLLLPQSPLYNIQGVSTLAGWWAAQSKAHHKKKREDEVKEELRAAMTPYLRQYALQTLHIKSATTDAFFNDTIFPYYNMGRDKFEAYNPKNTASGVVRSPIITIIRVSAALNGTPKYSGFVSSLRITRNDCNMADGKIQPPSVLYVSNLCVDGIANSGEKALSLVIQEISDPSLQRQNGLDVSFVPTAAPTEKQPANKTPMDIPQFILITVDGDTKSEMSLHQSGIIQAIYARCTTDLLSKKSKGELRNRDDNIHMIVLTEAQLFQGIDSHEDNLDTLKGKNGSHSQVPQLKQQQPIMPAKPALSFDFSSMSQFGSKTVTVSPSAIPKALWASIPLHEQVKKRLGIDSALGLLSHVASRIGKDSSIPGHLPDAFVTSCPTVRHMQPSAQRTGSFNGILTMLPRKYRDAIEDKRMAAEQQGFGGANGSATGGSLKGANDELLSFILNQLTMYFQVGAERASMFRRKFEEYKSKQSAASEAEEDSEPSIDIGTSIDGLGFAGEIDNLSAESKDFLAQFSVGLFKVDQKEILRSVVTESTLLKMEERLEIMRDSIIGLKALQAYRGTEKIRAWVVPTTGLLARFLIERPAVENLLQTTIAPKRGQKPKLVDLAFPVIRPSFVHNGTATGRLLCRDPNLQNIPKGSTAAANFDARTMMSPDGELEAISSPDETETLAKRISQPEIDEGISLRKLLTSRFASIPPEDDATNGSVQRGTLIEIDYSQLEPVAAAAITRDPALVDEICLGVDQHCKRVALYLHKTYDEIYDLCKVQRSPTYIEHRQKMKVFSFQRQFGAGPKTISATTGLTIPVIQKLIEDEKRIYPGVEAFHKLVEECASPASVSATEKIRANWIGSEKAAFLRGFESPNNNGIFPLVCGTKFGFIKGAGTTRVKNHPTQGFATELVQTAVGMVYMHLLKRGMLGDIVMVNTVHDSIWLDCRCTREELLSTSPSTTKSGKPPIRVVLKEIEDILVSILPIYQQTFNTQATTPAGNGVQQREVAAFATVSLKVESAAGTDLSAMKPIRFDNPPPLFDTPIFDTPPPLE